MHLRDYLRDKGLSQAAFGASLEPSVSASKVNHWLEGRRRVSLVEGLQVLRLSGGLVSLQELADMYRPGCGELHVASLGAAALTVYPNSQAEVV